MSDLNRNPYFTEVQWSRLLLYVHKIRDLMGLGGWRIELAFHTPAEEAEEAHQALGYVVPIDGRYIAHVFLANDFPEVEPWKQRHVIVHELSHLYTKQALDVVLAAFRQLSEPTYNVAWPVFKDAMEYQVDEIARTIAASFPLPDLNKPLGKKAQRRLKKIRS